MEFYKNDKNMLVYLKEIINILSRDGRPNLHNKISITWVRYEDKIPKCGDGFGASLSKDKIFYPASIIKLFYGVAAEVWIQKNIIYENEELLRAMSDMISESSNDATSLVIDTLTGTNSGPSLPYEKYKIWKKQRLVINEWLTKFNWQEFKSINCCQKTWQDGPYGREKDFYGKDNSNRNKLTTNSTARLLESIMTGNLLSPKATRRQKKYLFRSNNLVKRSLDSNNQIDGFIGEGLSENTYIWSKAGWMSEVRHDAAWWSQKDSVPMMAVIFTQGKDLSEDNKLLPEIGKYLNEYEK